MINRLAWALLLMSTIPAAYGAQYKLVFQVKGIASAEPEILESCKAILEAGQSTGDGIYSIKPGAASTSFDVHCDMTYDGGGWTKVAYQQDIPVLARWSGGDAWRWLPDAPA